MVQRIPRCIGAIVNSVCLENWEARSLETAQLTLVTLAVFEIFVGRDRFRYFVFNAFRSLDLGMKANDTRAHMGILRNIDILIIICFLLHLQSAS